MSPRVPIGCHGTVPGRRSACSVLMLLTALVPAGRAAAEEPIALRLESFVVAPAHSPSAVVVVVNHGQEAFEGTVRVTPPEGWQLSPAEQQVALGPGERKRVAFIVKQGTIRESNRYPLEASMTAGGRTVTRRQEVVTASAPYFRPEIDGNTDDWKDAIPVTWTTGGKKTVISTYWSRRQFSILVAVEEDELVPFSDKPGPEGFDAVQLAISPQDAVTGASADDEADRYEFLFVSTGSGTGGNCFLLAEPAMKQGACQAPRELGALEYDKAEVAVSRSEGVTYYECSIPFSLMRDRIPPSEGREFHLSVLVHDTDGTGVRDWGEEAGLGPEERSRLAWSLWPGAKWGDDPPMDNKTRWGLCSSKY